MKSCTQPLSAIGVLLLVTIVMAFALAGCGDDDGAETTATATQEADHADNHDEEVDTEIAIKTSDDFAYDPSQVTVAADERIRIALDNSDAKLLHDLTIEGLEADNVHSEGAEHEHMDNEEMDDHMDDEEVDDHMDEHLLHVAADPGEMGVLEFTPLEPGEYVFYCTVAGHREAGMEGTLIVQ